MPHTLLLADDSPAIQRVVELTFANEDVRVVAVGDGQQAIERLTAERPDIVLADIAMPLADGYAVAEFARATAATRDVPVLLLAGAFDIVEESRLGASGARGVLVKPFEPHVVISRVKELLGLGTGSDAAAPAESARLITPAEPERPPRTLSADPPFWREPARAPASPALAVPAAAGPTAPPAATATSSMAAPVEPVRAVAAAPVPPAPAAASTPAIAQAPSSAPTTSGGEAISSELVERIAARVVEQLGERLRAQVAEAVLDVSERLVRDEIAHIRAEAARHADEN